jgi:hypothetical protein
VKLPSELPANVKMPSRQTTISAPEPVCELEIVVFVVPVYQSVVPELNAMEAAEAS